MVDDAFVHRENRGNTFFFDRLRLAAAKAVAPGGLGFDQVFITPCGGSVDMSAVRSARQLNLGIG